MAERPRRRARRGDRLAVTFAPAWSTDTVAGGFGHAPTNRPRGDGPRLVVPALAVDDPEEAAYLPFAGWLGIRQEIDATPHPIRAGLGPEGVTLLDDLEHGSYRALDAPRAPPGPARPEITEPGGRSVNGGPLRFAGMTELSPEVRELLGARNMAHVATLMADGAPHVSPVWVALEGDRLAIFSAEENLKIRNLRRDGRVGVSVCDEHNPYRAAIIRGRVIDELEGDQAVAIMDRMSNRYVGTDFPVRTAIVSLIQPERVRFQELPFEHRASD